MKTIKCHIEPQNAPHKHGGSNKGRTIKLPYRIKDLAEMNVEYYNDESLYPELDFNSKY